jgi:hypothetical protein
VKSPIESYLAQLDSALEHGLPQRTRKEIRDHLRALARHHFETEPDRVGAEHRAIAEFGSAELIAEQFNKGGGPMEGRYDRWATPLAAILMLPGFFFMIANTLKFQLGIAPGLYDNTFRTLYAIDSHVLDVIVNAVVILGPVAAVIAIALSGVDLGLKIQNGALTGNFAIRFTMIQWIVLGVTVLVVLAMATYFFLENGPCWVGITWC